MILKVVFKENENLIITKKIVNPFLKFIYKPKFFNYECNLVHYHWNCCRFFGR